jgi:phage gp36-like protein
MSYITQTQLEARFASLKWWTDDAAAGAIDAAIVAAQITAAEGAINGAAGQHYALPLSLSTPETAATVALHAGTIAGYLLASRKSAVDDNLRAMYEDTLKWLKELAAGRVSLAGESATSVPTPGGGIIIAGGTTLVDRTSMDGL